jgi:hypothetical protein
MPTIYTIEAYSPSLNQTQRQIDLTNIMAQGVTQADANIRAQQFCEVKNKNFDMHVCDWQPIVKQQEVGLHTFNGQ